MWRAGATIDGAPCTATIREERADRNQYDVHHRMHPPPGPHRLRHAHGKCIFRDSTALHPSRVSVTVVTRIYPKMLTNVFFVMSGIGCTARPTVSGIYLTHACVRERVTRATVARPATRAENKQRGARGGRGGAAAARPQRPPTAAGRADFADDAGRTPDAGRRWNMDVSGRHRSTRAISTPNNACPAIYCWKDFRFHRIPSVYHPHSVLPVLSPYITAKVYETSLQQEISSIIYYIFSSIKINDIKRLVDKLDRLNKISYSLRTSR